MTHLNDLHRALLCKARAEKGTYCTHDHRDEWNDLVNAGYAKHLRRIISFDSEQNFDMYRLTDEGAKFADANMDWWKAQQERR